MSSWYFTTYQLSDIWAHSPPAVELQPTDHTKVIHALRYKIVNPIGPVHLRNDY